MFRASLVSVGRPACLPRLAETGFAYGRYGRQNKLLPSQETLVELRQRTGTFRMRLNFYDELPQTAVIFPSPSVSL